MKRAFVLGSGIAGLSLAEILSRNGYRITLVDSAKDLGGDASRCTQNWLHTGWLYAGLPYDGALMGCARAMRLFREVYEHVLPASTVNIDAGDHGISYPDSPSGWFDAERVHYLFAQSTYELSFLERATWKHYLENVALRRLRGLGYPTDAVANLPKSLVGLMNRWEGGPDGHSKYRVVESTDARINTRHVLGTLLELLGEGTEVITGADYELIRNGAQTSVKIGGETHTPDLVVMASGKNVPHLLRQIDEEAVASRFSSISSPIVVLKRALDLPSFIRFTPRLPETLNHIKYDVGGVEVSTIGSYDYYPADRIPDITPFVNKMCTRLGVSASDVVGSYYGTKTELTGGLARRYNHAVERVNGNTFFAIAGKFSQFPLLVTDFAEQMGLRTDIANDTRGKLRHDVGETAPERLAARGIPASKRVA